MLMCAGVPGGKKRVWVPEVGVRVSCKPPGVALGTKLRVLQYPVWKGKRKPATSRNWNKSVIEKEGSWNSSFLIVSTLSF